MRRKSTLAAAVFTALVALLPLSPAASAGTGEGTGTDVIAWAPCEEEPAVECGTLAVPIDWSRPKGPTIDLALARRKATDPAARIGSMLINPGGPGGSGVDFAYSSPDFFTEEIRQRFDLVGFDPRGVGRSHPVVCSASLYNRMPPAIMTSQADFDRWTGYARKLRQDCRARTGPLYDHVDSVNVARDMDAIRAALGEAKLTYYGVSYGTLIGQMYAELFPHRIRAMALDSNMDHSLDVKRFLDTEAAGVEDAFDQFVGWCDHEAECVLHGQDVRQVWERLLAKARAGELYYPGVPDRPMTELQVLWQGVLGTEGPDWRLLAEMLRALDGGPLPDWVPPLPGRGPVAGELAELPTAVLCQDYRLPVRNYQEYAALLRSSARQAPDMRLNPMPIEDLPVCLGHPTTNPQHRLRYTGDVPLLLGTTMHDPSTPYSWTTNVARQLGPKAALLIYEGWGHRIYGKEECATVPIDDYLIAGIVPPPGFRCEVAGGSDTLRKPPTITWPTDDLPWATH
ncbi:peptidase [Sphaerisporangium rufum]|uniref:Peptidase n=1 Tax=Sphaerisporangium rufum TaxID=1381558 RepID=A0A919QYR9_9ACTN|nr:alpha/beta hydrolase [Sphaerisporangium rufum]GII76534.1 peptidase [Sphaerisporangium rufum]